MYVLTSLKSLNAHGIQPLQRLLTAVPLHVQIVDLHNRLSDLRKLLCPYRPLHLFGRNKHTGKAHTNSSTHINHVFWSMFFMRPVRQQSVSRWAQLLDRHVDDAVGCISVWRDVHSADVDWEI